MNDGALSPFPGVHLRPADFLRQPSGGQCIKSVPFVQNHGSERNGSTLSCKSGATNTLATEFMLAYGYGTPQAGANAEHSVELRR